jgi:heptaprenyl diphosphate synthase
MAMLTAVAMILSYVEAMLPSIAIPGVKMGLANIAVVFALYRFGWKEAVAISLIRVVLMSMLFTGVAAMLYSLAGAAVSLILMGLLKKINAFSAVGVSVAGGVGHNAGQVLLAMWMLETGELTYYLPALAISGVISGVLIGLAGGMLVNRMKKVSG